MVKYKEKYNKLKNRLSSPIDELIEGKLIPESEVRFKLKELEELREFKKKVGEKDLGKLFIESTERLVNRINLLDKTEKERLRLLKENIKLKGLKNKK